MVKALDYDQHTLLASRDSRFESWEGHLFCIIAITLVEMMKYLDCIPSGLNDRWKSLPKMPSLLEHLRVPVFT